MNELSFFHFWNCKKSVWIESQSFYGVNTQLTILYLFKFKPMEWHFRSRMVKRVQVLGKLKRQPKEPKCQETIEIEVQLELARMVLALQLAMGSNWLHCCKVMAELVELEWYCRNRLVQFVSIFPRSISSQLVDRFWWFSCWQWLVWMWWFARMVDIPICLGFEWQLVLDECGLEHLRSQHNFGLDDW